MTPSGRGGSPVLRHPIPDPSDEPGSIRRDVTASRAAVAAEGGAIESATVRTMARSRALSARGWPRPPSRRLASAPEDQLVAATAPHTQGAGRAGAPAGRRLAKVCLVSRSSPEW